MSASDAPLGGAEGTCFWLKSELDGDDGGGDGAGEGNAMPSRLFAVGGRGSAGGGGGKGGGGDGSGLYGLGGGGGDGSGLNGKGGGGGGGDGEGGGGGDGDATLCCSRLHSGSLVAANSAAASRRRPHAAPTTPVEQPATVACDPPSSTSMPSATPRDASASIIAMLPVRSFRRRARQSRNQGRTKEPTVLAPIGMRAAGLKTSVLFLFW